MTKKDFILKEISPLAVIKTATLFLSSIIGLVGALVILTSLFKGWKAFGDSVLGTFFGVFILSPAYGLISGLAAVIYNWVARKTGGYRITLEVEDKN